VAAWLEFFFRSTSELLLDVGDEDGRTACLARNGIDGRDALVAKWPRLAGGKTRVVAVSSSDGNGAFTSVVRGKGFPFITTAGCNGHLTIRYLVQATRSSTMVSP
jgi:hypothetical protein